MHGTMVSNMQSLDIPLKNAHSILDDPLLGRYGLDALWHNIPDFMMYQNSSETNWRPT